MRLKFISLNAWIGGVLFDEIVTFLRKEDADVVVLQEVLEGTDRSLPVQYQTVTALQEQLKYPYQDFEASCIDRFPWGDIPNGNAILSKFPIIDRGATPLDGHLDSDRPREPFAPDSWPVTPRTVQHVTLNTPAGEVNVFNFQGVWDLDGDNVSPQRQKMVDALLSATADKRNVILAGDTNAKPTNPAMKPLENNLTSVFGTSLISTFNMRRKTNPGYGTAAVDMIYTSRNLRVIEKHCPDIDVSDHLPLVATFEIEEEE